jgi:phosphoglycolate phosphatase-like HAD superfamily hydrolase
VPAKSLAIDLDAVLGDTRPLFEAWLDEASRRYDVEAGDYAELGNWERLLERFAEDRAPVYLRPRAGTNATLRRLKAAGARLGAFTDAPEPLARVALAHLGAARLLDTVKAGAGARERLLRELGPDAVVVGSPDELTRAGS